jgi:hypothetical protein
MEIVAKLVNRKGKVFEIKVNKPKPLAIPIFMAKLGRYANKNHKITEFYCNDYQFMSMIIGSLPPTCKTTMIRENDF